MKEIFKRHPRYGAAPQDFESIPENLWIRCPHCRELLYSKELEQTFRVCSKCKYHLSVTARERIRMTVDEGTFVECAGSMRSIDPLHFESRGESYAQKLEQYHEQSDTDESFIYGTAQIEGQDAVLGLCEFSFAGGSMGAVFGERLVRAIEEAQNRETGLVVFSSGGGARMQEGTVSLLQMAKTVAALDRLKASGLPFISVMTDPCLGGITASYAMLGDVNIGEPGAYIGFAGRRVIEQTMRQKLPQDAATAEFLLQHGMLDLVVPRAELPSTIGKLLRVYRGARQAAAKRQLVEQPV
jgi:acetyl-CoA carboxylase carboxyl transferase subunit beta